MRNDQDSKLYKYRNYDKTNYNKDYPEKAKEMESYAKSNIQVFQYLLLHDELLGEAGLLNNK